ncbi:MAG: ribonuclease P protein component [Candidatus Rokuibacteriota bacterium]|jgi:ribonuclease P protein component|nr:MAG: ribonuclease P protein component [Candidatus Rokubacteria bacterium]
MSTLWRFDDRRGSIARETDISAECAPTEENPWVPRADEDQGRAEGVETPAGQGAQTADRLTGRFPRHERLTTGSDFQALFQRGKRVDRPSMTILWCESVDARRVGFAVSRQVRRAVAKNRVRRRLREAYRATRAAAPARAMLVVIGKPSALSEPFATLANQLRGALAAIPGARA